jgi:hypothetical protein
MNKDDRYYLGEKDAAIVFHDDGSFEMALPMMGDDDMVDINSNTVFVIALSLCMRNPEFCKMIDEQRVFIAKQMEEGCPEGPSCGGCGGGCGEKNIQ